MNKIKFASIITAVALATSIGAVAAKPDEKEPKQHFRLPENAVEIEPNVFALGTARDTDGSLVEGYAFVHPKYENGKYGKGSGPKGGGTTCYAFLASGAKWKSVEPYLFNPANTDSFDEATAALQLAAGITEWEKNVSPDIISAGTVTSDPLSAESVTPDGLNEVFFAQLDDTSTIAVTITWGVFGGPPQNRKLVEWDMVFNDPDYAWGDVVATGNTALMDFQNIATHELGHAIGMGHPSDSCVEETMYRFGSNGEIKKRDLNTGDIAGIKKLYQ
ncbi:MAG: hypothetical protein A3G60_01460 [Candidatus Ryanbacteria bacterium RIFCSPLOWO2_12_FULL_47_9c]|uniref:Peptidase M10 metallopeptidase domain-containing protein n=1 Tax=Candidatus Ryanbacteria bacterium RIFCSPLOWO2_12_FULL_47_9c TaxID=1802131 RepID=A0A1G2H473_9BACT|nr:MAG: hypothetical protein UX74_C0009G0009 [Parcubacteria group bacterium GW2011_GWA2_47_10b]OGZ46696.1 MAG: hypothetical protein A2844_02165 [Candidatus Ryanbacteria bacterium RIFCSPHIGHO2_01_FULL_48_80]OGZ48041.1 MAG: hypothetical protein A3C83_02750 [Candidatus Ryanbacteria bacterium RIFCSPHIGHO2_02_FULL_47_25]OGZ51358.1 MAG: hypothetical protein A3A29_01975 [Candidatus Ryanbacteria bacterium RIFCSPLOWO2_01_FULL_47_79]OGZ57295.1 MAG: hypothetical protein A3G60_01460 [Candidatus Ryanbacteri